MLARYSVDHELGRGAIGAVYAARDRETGAVVALKRLDPALLGKSDANFADRFLKHARSARHLKHRNIARVHDAGEAGGTLYVAMEMLEGRNLRDILDAGPLPVARAIQIAHDIACGLAHAHLQGVVHGCLKPSNVIVLPSGVVKITDFGVGCPGYMSPEQVRGQPVDHRCDIFALGALFYEMLAHRPAFEGGSPKEITERILHAKPPLPSDLNPHVPRALDAIVLSMLAGEPAVRMPGAPILIGELQRLEEGLGLGSGASAGIDEPEASASPATPEPGPRTPDAVKAFDHRKAMAMMERESRAQRSYGPRAGTFATLALVIGVLGIGGVAGYMSYFPGPSQPGIAASRMQEAPATAPGASQASLPPAVNDGQEEQAALPAPLPVAEAAKELAAAPVAPEAPAPRAEVAEPQPGRTAQVIVAVSPRGEIYIDGKHHGTTPPITTFALAPGMHRIEVRSGSRKPYLTYMAVQAGDVRRIRHDFDASRAVPPAQNASWQSRHRPAR